MTRRVFEDREFEGRQIRDKRTVVRSLEFRRCEFIFSSLAVTRDVRKRAIVQDVVIENCVADACTVQGAVLEDVTVDGLRSPGIFRVSAAAFRHVTLRGQVDDLLVHPSLWPGPVTEAEQRSFDDANAAFYADTDWALDIRDAEFGAAEIKGVPTRLIRRDPETQVVVSHHNALQGKWRRLGLNDTPWPALIQFLIDDGDVEKLLIAPKRSRDFRRLQQGLMRLKEAGVAQ